MALDSNAFRQRHGIGTPWWRSCGFWRARGTYDNDHL